VAKPRYRYLGETPEGRPRLQYIPDDETPPEETPEDQEPGIDDEPPSGEALPVILEEYGPTERVPLNAHEASVLGAWYQAVGGYLSGAEHYDKDGNLIDYAARIESFAGETIGGDVIETRLNVIDHYALTDEIPDGPYDR
jgi:hypothetical protein